MIVGNQNTANKNDVGDKGKGNGRDGISITGNNNRPGRPERERRLRNGHDGIDMVGNNNMLAKKRPATRASRTAATASTSRATATS